MSLRATAVILQGVAAVWSTGSTLPTAEEQPPLARHQSPGLHRPALGLQQKCLKTWAPSLPEVTSGTGQTVFFQLNIQQQLFFTFFCALTLVSLLHLQLKSDFLIISEQLGNGVWMDRSIPKDLPKREDFLPRPLCPGLEHSHTLSLSAAPQKKPTLFYAVVVKSEKLVV